MVRKYWTQLFIDEQQKPKSFAWNWTLGRLEFTVMRSLVGSTACGLWLAVEKQQAHVQVGVIFVLFTFKVQM